MGTTTKTTVSINGGPEMSMEDFETRAHEALAGLVDRLGKESLELTRADEQLVRRALETVGKELVAARKKLGKLAIVETKVDARIQAALDLRKRVNAIYDPDALDFDGWLDLDAEEQITLLTGIHLLIMGLYDQLEAMRQEKLQAAYRDVARRINAMQRLADRISGQGNLPLEGDDADDQDGE